MAKKKTADGGAGKKKKPLTILRQRFRDEYLAMEKPNATKAALLAGYSKKTAYSQGQRLLKNVEIAAAIDKAKAERSKRTEIDADFVLTTIVDSIKRCIDKKDEGNVLRGCDLLGKHLSLHSENQNVNLSGVVNGKWIFEIVRPTNQSTNT